MEQIREDKLRPLIQGSIGSEMVVYDLIDSTNNAAKLLAKNGAPHGAAVIARQQTAGRGRLGRSFFSPKGTGIYLTVVLRPALPAAQSLLLTAAAAVATARAIERITAVSPKIKWVNDLYIQGKKFCGILAESALTADGMLAYVVMGIGINLTTDSFPPELQEIATCLAAAGSGDWIDPNYLIAELFHQLDLVCDQLETREFMAEYRSRSCVVGKMVQFMQGGETVTATAVDINRDGHLVVQTEDGAYQIISSGEISLKGDWE